MVSYNEEYKQSREHSSWTFSGKESKGPDVSRDIIYANLIDCLYDLLGFDRSKYIYLVLKVVYQSREKIIDPTVINNDEDLGFFLDEISISIQHQIPLCISVVERTIPAISNLT